MWSEALPLLTRALGGVGAACFAFNDQTKAIEWAYMSGPASGLKAEYIDHYASLDIYLPVICASEPAGWLTLSECLPDSILRHSEWYNDFVRACGIADVVGIQIHQAGPRRVYFGAHYDKVQTSPPRQKADFKLLLDDLGEAARIEQAHRMLSLKTSIGTWTTDYLSDALFVVYDNGRVIEMNSEAERMLSGGHGLAIRKGRLVAIEPVREKRLADLMAAAGTEDEWNAAASRVLVGGVDRRHAHLVSVFPLKGQLAPDDRAMVVVRAVDLFTGPPSDADLAEIFGLSPAENRLVNGLVQGKTPQELTKEFGVRMPTLRAQIQSVFRKCGVQRQVDLMLVLLRAR